MYSLLANLALLILASFMTADIGYLFLFCILIMPMSIAALVPILILLAYVAVKDKFFDQELYNFFHVWTTISFTHMAVCLVYWLDGSSFIVQMAKNVTGL